MLAPSQPSIVVPQGACDCHVHVSGPFDKHPLAPKRSYTPPPATITDLIARMDAAGVDRAVIVQPRL
jgi:predicted TIM-barrel fold metal-dependent hydrolase